MNPEEQLAQMFYYAVEIIKINEALQAVEREKSLKNSGGLPLQYLLKGYQISIERDIALRRERGEGWNETQEEGNARYRAYQTVLENYPPEFRKFYDDANASTFCALSENNIPKEQQEKFLKCAQCVKNIGQYNLNAFINNLSIVHNIQQFSKLAEALASSLSSSEKNDVSEKKVEKHANLAPKWGISNFWHMNKQPAAEKTSIELSTFKGTPELWNVPQDFIDKMKEDAKQREEDFKKEINIAKEMESLIVKIEKLLGDNISPENIKVILEKALLTDEDINIVLKRCGITESLPVYEVSHQNISMIRDIFSTITEFPYHCLINSANHWMLLSINEVNNTKEITFLDSMRVQLTDPTPGTTARNLLKTTFEKENYQWKDMLMQGNDIQEDDYSCGDRVISLFLRTQKNQNVPEWAQKSTTVDDRRSAIFDILIEAAKQRLEDKRINTAQHNEHSLELKH